jgi:type IV pilus assembly protein PilA
LSINRIYLEVLMNRMRKAAQRGQGTVEYIIIVALIGIASIAVYQWLGDTVRNQTAAVANELAGVDGTAQREAAAAAAVNAAKQENTNRNLSNYTNNVGQ